VNVSTGVNDHNNDISNISKNIGKHYDRAFMDRTKLDDRPC